MYTSKIVQNFLALVIAGILVMFSAGCHSPNAPTPPPVTTCQDKTASNFGGPLPCVPWPTTAPVTSFVTMVSMTPASGATLPYLPFPYMVPTNPLKLVVNYGISQADQDATKGTDLIRLYVCLTTVATPLSFTSFPMGCVDPDIWLGPSSRSYGTTTLQPYVPDTQRGVVNQTSYIIVEMWRLSTGKIIPTMVISWPINWT